MPGPSLFYWEPLVAKGSDLDEEIALRGVADPFWLAGSG